MTLFTNLLVPISNSSRNPEYYRSLGQQYRLDGSYIEIGDTLSVNEISKVLLGIDLLTSPELDEIGRYITRNLQAMGLHKKTFNYQKLAVQTASGVWQVNRVRRGYDQEHILIAGLIIDWLIKMEYSITHETSHDVMKSVADSLIKSSQNQTVTE